jgi:hypothetical protein
METGTTECQKDVKLILTLHFYDYKAIFLSVTQEQSLKTLEKKALIIVNQIVLQY